MSAILIGRPYSNFINSIKSQESKIKYKNALNRYMSFYHISSLEALLKIPIQDTESMLIDYLTHLKNEDLSSGYMSLCFSAIKHFYYMNDVRINKEKIAKFMGEAKKKNNDRGYRHDEIKKLLDVSDLRFKTMIFLLASTGIRIGAIPSMRLKHIQKRGDLYKITVYEGTKDEYFTFATPECSSCLDSYLEMRKRCGERLEPDSLVIREQFDISDMDQVRKRAKPVSKSTLSNTLHNYLLKAGIREINHNFTNRERFEVPMAHGFRKFCTTQLVHSKINPEIREMLLGHKIGLASAYYRPRPSEDEVLSEFRKAIDLLTINQENRLKREVKQLTEKQDEIAYMKLEHQKQINALRVELEPLLTLKDTLIREGVLKEHHH